MTYPNIAEVKATTKETDQPSPAINEGEKERVFTLQEMMECWDHAVGSTSDLLSGKVEYFKTKFDININD